MVYITHLYSKKKHTPQQQVSMPENPHKGTPIVGGAYLEQKETKEDKIKKKNTTTVANLPPQPNKAEPKESMDKSTEEKLKKFVSLKIL